MKSADLSTRVSNLVRAESMSKTSLAKCFLCFWMLGMSTCREHWGGHGLEGENAACARKPHLSNQAQRLHHISLYLELKLDELLGQPLLCLAAQLQHLPVRRRQSEAIERHTRVMRTEGNSIAQSIPKADPPPSQRVCAREGCDLMHVTLTPGASHPPTLPLPRSCTVPGWSAAVFSENTT